MKKCSYIQESVVGSDSWHLLTAHLLSLYLLYILLASLTANNTAYMYVTSGQCTEYRGQIMEHYHEYVKRLDLFLSFICRCCVNSTATLH
jgi:hypothetical protein